MIKKHDFLINGGDTGFKHGPSTPYIPDIHTCHLFFKALACFDHLGFYLIIEIVGVDMMLIFNEKIQRGDMMQGFDDKSCLADNAKASDIDNPHISETINWNFELFVEEFVRENLLDFVDDVLCGLV